MSSNPDRNTILLANNYHYRRGGAEVVYLQQDEMLRKVGYQTAHMSMNHPKNEHSDWQRFFVDEIEWGNNYSAMQKIHIAKTIIDSKQAYENTRALIQESGARLLHGHNIYHHLSPSVLRAATDEGIPSVITLHDYKVLCPSYDMLSDGKVCEACKGGKLHNLVIKRCMKGSLGLSSLIAVESVTHRLTGAYSKHVDRFVSPSQFLIDKFVEWGWPRERFAYVPNCVNIENHDVSESIGKRFLFIGRLSREKGLVTLVSAAARAGVGLDIVGAGPITEELHKQAESLGADVAFHGFQTGDALWSFIQGCRAIVLPSEWYENAPISIIEAYASGKPVIVANVGGMPEMVVHDQTGLIVESAQPDALAAALQQMADKSDAQVAEMGRAGRALAEKNYSPQRQAQLLIEVYQKLGAPAPVKRQPQVKMYQESMA